MLKWRIKLLVLALISVFAVFCLTGCDYLKDVYGASSDYIKVSHPDRPNVNAFSEEETDSDPDFVIENDSLTAPESDNGSKSDTSSAGNDSIVSASDTAAAPNLAPKPKKKSNSSEKAQSGGTSSSKFEYISSEPSSSKTDSSSKTESSDKASSSDSSSKIKLPNGLEIDQPDTPAYDPDEADYGPVITF